MQFRVVAAENQLTEDRGFVVEVEGRPIVIFLRGSHVFALDDLCPHAGASLERGRLIGNAVECPMHGAKFDLSTGLCRTRHVPANQRLVTHSVRLLDGRVELALASEPVTQPDA